MWSSGHHKPEKRQREGARVFSLLASLVLFRRAFALFLHMALGSLTKFVEVKKLTRSEKREKEKRRAIRSAPSAFLISQDLPRPSLSSLPEKQKQAFLVANAEVAEALSLPSTDENAAATAAAAAAAQERLAEALRALEAATDGADGELDAAAVRAARRAAAAAAAAAGSPSSTSPSPREARDASVKALNALASALADSAAARTK